MALGHNLIFLRVKAFQERKQYQFINLMYFFYKIIQELRKIILVMNLFENPPFNVSYR